MTSHKPQVTALVTGASRGLGLDFSIRLLALGYQVIGVSLTKKHWFSAVKKANSEHFSLIQADLSNESEVRNLFQEIKKNHSKLDLLVNNSAYGGVLQRIEDTTPSEFQSHLQSNLFSVFLMCHEAFPLLKKSQLPLVMNVSSMAGVRAVPQIAGYSASKFGVLAMTEAFAKENPDWLKVVTICPGGMNTEMRASLFGKEDAAKQQTTEFVARTMEDVLTGKVELVSGSHIVIRHGKITQIIVPPNN